MLCFFFSQLALYVLSFLEPKDLLQAAQTCRYWRILAEDNLLWREKCKEEGKVQNHREKMFMVRKSRVILKTKHNKKTVSFVCLQNKVVNQFEKELWQPIKESRLHLHLHSPAYIKSTGYSACSDGPDLGTNPFNEHRN